MPEKSRFFDSTPEDPREYSMSEFAEYFQRLLTNGIFNGGANLQVDCTGANINTRVKPGYAWINGYMYKVYDTPVELTHDLPDALLDRIDRVAIRLDTTLAGRYIQAKIIKGVAAAEPEPPALTRNENVYEISLAQVQIIAGKSYIEAYQITDERLDTDVCGLVNSLIQADTTSIFNQFQAWYDAKTVEFENEWDDWFTQQQAGSGAYALQADLTDLENEVTSHKAGTAGLTVKGHVQLSSSVTSTSETLAATAKAVKTAMDRADSAFQSANDGKTNIAGVIGSPALSSDTFATLKNYIQANKNTLATNLSNKGQASVGTEALAALVAKVANVSTGKKYATGTTSSGATFINGTSSNGSTRSTLPFITVSGLSFTPSVVIITMADGSTQRFTMLGNYNIGSVTAPATNARIFFYQTAPEWLSLDGSAVYVTNGGFQLPAGSTNKSWRWEAFE